MAQSAPLRTTAHIMIQSMTGFGKASRAFNGDDVGIEVSSVNHRYLDCHVRTPSLWNAFEMPLKQAVRERLARGKVNVMVTRKRGGQAGASVQFNREVAESYITASKELNHLLGSLETLDLDTLMTLDGVLTIQETEEDAGEVQAFLTALAGEAVDALRAMRATEGEALAKDLVERIGIMKALLGGIEQRLPAIREQYEARLRARIEELQVDPGIAEERVSLEVAILADKGDVTEEIVRLRAHFDHFQELLDGNAGAVGRKLDFLTQELGREVNTLGVKCRDTEVARDVLDLKAELEKIREQVQNVE